MKVLYIPTVTGGTTCNPSFIAHHLDDLGIFCELESQGHEVTVATFYRRPNGRLKWPRTIPFFFEPGSSKGFDMILLHPKVVGTMKYLANPALHARPNYYRHSELVLPEIAAFDGPLVTYINDARPSYMKEWDVDWDAYVAKQMARDTHILSTRASLAFTDFIGRVEKRWHKSDFDKWSAKWVLENLADFSEKDLDFVFDGYNALSGYSPERKAFLKEAAQRFPNSATVGRLKIKGLPSLHNGKIANGYDELWPILTRAKYRPLSWEPFHLETQRLWTPRVTAALASNSLAFTPTPDTPFLTRSLEDLAPPTKRELRDQKELLESFAKSKPWPVEFAY